MKRFLLFAGATCYPLGGLRDLIGSGDTVEQAKERAGLVEETPEYGGTEWYCRDVDSDSLRAWINWWYVLDTQELKIVEGCSLHPFQLELEKHLALLT
jgi:hypothetical protein